MSRHDDCRGVGKFDCTTDEYVNNIVLEAEPGEGHVESPVAWFAEITLEDQCEGHEHDPGTPSSNMGESIYCDGSCQREHAIAQHYGTRYLIAREFNDGRFAVEPYEREQDRDERLGELRAAYAEWDMGVLS